MTDRRAFQGARAASGELTGPAREALREAIRNAAAAGVDWIQIREKDLAGHALTELARLAVADTRGTPARILVNDRLDAALAANAHGIHLGETSLPLEAVAEWRRSNRKDFQIGVSCHALETARAAERGGADYIFFGPVFATPSKAAFGPPQGVERLREVCASVGKIPVLAIGGVTLENAGLCVAAGAAGIAAIRLFQDNQSLAASVARLREIQSGKG